MIRMHTSLLRYHQPLTPLFCFFGLFPGIVEFDQMSKNQGWIAPLLLVLEDAHWLDDLSRDLTHYVAQTIADRPILFLTIYRPPEIEQQPPLWSPPPPAFMAG